MNDSNLQWMLNEGKKRNGEKPSHQSTNEVYITSQSNEKEIIATNDKFQDTNYEHFFLSLQT